MKAPRRHAEVTDQREREDRRRRAFDADDRNLWRQQRRDTGTGMPVCAAQRSDRAGIPSDPFTLLARARRAQRGIAAGG